MTPGDLKRIDSRPIPDSREEIPPEDMPVKTRQQPGYEPVGIRAGSWMFNPSLIAGSFYDSNVFSSNTTAYVPATGNRVLVANFAPKSAPTPTLVVSPSPQTIIS